MTPPPLRLAVLALAGLWLAATAQAETLTLHTRRRDAAPGDPQRWTAAAEAVAWESTRTAIVICDMWDRHHCPDATDRVGEMAPRVNQVIQAARARGVLIIHCPSDTMDFYKDHPGRKLAQAAPVAATQTPLEGWCALRSAKEPPLPVDDSDGGCDGCPECPGYKAWSRQHPAIEIRPGDAITDSVEAFYLMRQRGITNVIVLGVHANMCVLGRPFSIRQMVAQGQNVLLMRDLTDSMYNHRKAPFVNHFQGTELIVEHIEKYWCPSVTSVDFLGGEPFRFREDHPKTIAFLIGEDEYQTDRTLPSFARDNLEWRGFRIRYYREQAGKPGDFGNLDDLASADALLVSVRRRNLPPDNLRRIRDFVASGKPVVGIRTASHAFWIRDGENPPDRSWRDFDRSVLGAHYEDHYPVGVDSTIVIADDAKSDPAVTGVHGRFTVRSHLYKNRDLAPTVKVLLTGRTDDGRSETEPVAWIHVGGPGRVFYTSLGAPSDFENPDFNRLLLNGLLWAVGAPIPPAGAALDEPNRTPPPAKAAAPRAEVRPAAASPPAVQAPPRSASGAAVDVGTAKAGPLSPEESLRRFRPADGLAVDLVLSEPDIAQPVQIQFDARGRLWVVEYRQYPNPAGLKMVSHDKYWRAVYDKIPAPPPGHVRGRDRITIHEDRDGDGRFETHTTFVDGLNIATSAAPGPAGVYVLNPPYLLHYPDANHDDVPDGDPEVLLSGFGLEDTHSVANSLRWGPDGWLYGCQGSTVTAHIRTWGADGKPGAGPAVFSQGQNIWRYHPGTRRYEIFAEGGGNAFGLEIDAAGRIFSGHNGGDTRGFHYQQGAYLQKGFEKHGPLSNPYAFGYFPPMRHNQAERFTHTFVINEAPGLPPGCKGRLFGAEPLQGRIVEAELQPSGSTFQTRDLGFALTSGDPWFRPVDIKPGPDGALYIADWYDEQVTHYRNHEGRIDASNGRVYRLRAASAAPAAKPPAALEALLNLPPGAAPDAAETAVVAALADSNRFVRQQAGRWIAEHGTVELSTRIQRRLFDGKGVAPARPAPVELLWAAHALGALDDALILRCLDHPDPWVRAWAVRLAADRSVVAPVVTRRIAELARHEPSLDVRVQWAGSARRLPARDGLPIVEALLRRDEDDADARQPLMLWWAVERWCGADRALVTDLFLDASLWRASMARSVVVPRLARRFAAAGAREDLMALALLFRAAPAREDAARLMTGFEQAFEGRTIPELPVELTVAMKEAGVESLWLAAGAGNAPALAKAVETLIDGAAPLNDRIRLAGVLAGRRTPEAEPVLLRLATGSAPPGLRHAALAGLSRFTDGAIGPAVAGAVPEMEPSERPAALALLTARPSFAAALLASVESGKLPKALVDGATVRRIRNLHDPELDKRASALWPHIRQPSSAETDDAVRRIVTVVQASQGDPYEGKKLFLASCAPCHRLFGQGASIGPDLTSYQRSDLDSMALNILAPNAEIREGYESFNVETKDGRSLSGFLAEQDAARVVLRGLDGGNTTIDRKDLVSFEPAGASLMPEGLLAPLTDPQIRNLFAYLRSTQPLND